MIYSAGAADQIDKLRRHYQNLNRLEAVRNLAEAGRYWIAYSTTKPPVILGVFFETADIPGRA